MPSDPQASETSADPHDADARAYVFGYLPCSPIFIWWKVCSNSELAR
jgi:hypothetical protein